METDGKRISVIIPTYGRSRYLVRAVDSVLAQTYPDVEAVVVDDNDPETEARRLTEEVMQAYSDDSRVVYVKHPENKNGAAARNTGIAQSSGSIISFLDDDDMYLPKKLELEAEYLFAHPEFHAVYCGYERDKSIIKPHKQGDLSFELLSGTDIIYTNTIMMYKADAISFGGWDERFRRNQEAVFLLRYFSHGGRIGAVSEVLVKFDTTDRSNAADPKRNEAEFDKYLALHQAEIDRCGERYPDAREMIYSYRLRGVLVNYIKHLHIADAVRLYRRANKLLPKRFRRDCMLYMKRRLKREPLFKEFDQK